MEAKIVQVTPTMAQKWLTEKNNHNRPIYEKTVESYASDMKRGLWAVNNQGIGFDEDGNLIDGQHRLQAVVYSGATVQMLVMRGIPKNYNNGFKTQLTVDQGKPRGLGDQLSLVYGIDNANLRVAIIRTLIGIIVPGNKKTSAGILLEVMKIYQDELNVVIANRTAVPGLIFAPALGAFVFAAKCFKDKVVDFEKQYFSGEDLSAGNPILTFRNYMLNRPSSGGGSTYRKAVQNNTLTCLMYHITEQKLKRIVQSLVGYEFFANRQKRYINQVSELFKY